MPGRTSPSWGTPLRRIGRVPIISGRSVRIVYGTVTAAIRQGMVETIIQEQLREIPHEEAVSYQAI